jgi:hypothetical protein
MMRADHRGAQLDERTTVSRNTQKPSWYLLSMKECTFYPSDSSKYSNPNKDGCYKAEKYQWRRQKDQAERHTSQTIASDYTVGISSMMVL